MKQLLMVVPLLLIACGPKATSHTVTVGRVTISDVEPIRAELLQIPGVQQAAAGQFTGTQVTYSVSYAGHTSELAAKLGERRSALKNVRGFDESSITIIWRPDAIVSVPPPVAPAPVAETPAVPPQTPAPTQAAVQEKPAVPEEPKEVKVEVKKDPLAYKVHQLPGGTVATFDGWKVTPLPGDSNWTAIQTYPEGKENDFMMFVFAGTPGAKVMANLFEEGRNYLQQMMPSLKPAGEAQKTVIGGDDARVQDYTAEWQGKSLKVQSIIIKKKDVAVSLLALGTEDAFKEYGRAVGITAQSITVKADPPDAALVGTWLLEKYFSSGAGTSSQFSHSSSMSMTIYPNGTFTESSSSASNLNNSSGTTSAYLDGGDRGKVVKRGTTLCFTYDNGKVWNSEYKMDGGALVMGKNYWLRQR